MLQAGRLFVYRAVAHFSPRIVEKTLRNEYWTTLLELIVQKLERATIGKKSLENIEKSGFSLCIKIDAPLKSY